MPFIINNINNIPDIDNVFFINTNKI